MKLKLILYKIIYQNSINYILRNINFHLKGFLPEKIKIPPSGLLNCKTDSGTIKIHTNQTSFLTQLLFWKGYKHFEYSEIFEDLSKNISNFLDIGSNIGYYSLLAVQSNPNIIVYALEPADGANFFLKKNIVANNFQNNISSHKIALSNTNDKIDFYEVESTKYPYLKYILSGENNTGTKKNSREFIKKDVVAHSLDNFILSQSIEYIDLIKIDTEGTEFEILISGGKFIKEFTPIIICETLFNTTEKDLEIYFKALDYEFYNHIPKSGLLKVNTILRDIDNGIRNCFFVPKNKIHLISKYIV
ncbi:MAG: FkbM family methyltransferase [Flavobacteriales bacterium]|jgi:FkbM family methyltransferase|nr:FkbM family methyltransferase [Flavobacteriales bacterium]